MIQLLFGMPHDNGVIKWWSDAVRDLFSVLDIAVYKLVEVMFQVFFAIANQEIIPASLMSEFYSRVQIVLGLVMIFKLSFTLLKTIINPDLLTDAQKGVGNIVIRIVTMLALFISIIPLPNIPAKSGSYNESIRNNGILFGTLFSLQDRILLDNVIGKLLLGNKEAKSEQYGGIINNDSSKILSKKSATEGYGMAMSAFVIRSFVQINLKEEATELASEAQLKSKNDKNLSCSLDSELDGDASDGVSKLSKGIKRTAGVIGLGLAGAAIGSFVCPGIGTLIGAAIGGGIGVLATKIQDMIAKHRQQSVLASDAYGIYYVGSATQVLSMVNYKCNKEKTYAFAYLPIISTITGIILLLTLISFCFDVAIRVFKLAILRLIAPIPIISYIDPKTSEKTFSTWVKMVTSTYLDLFIRLGIMYFIIFMSRNFMDLQKGVFRNISQSQFIGILVTTYIIVALFYFGRQMPKFIKEALGIKSDGDGLFSGLGKMVGFGATAVGTVGSVATNYRATMEEQKELHPGHIFSNFGKSIASGIVGGVAGFGTGMKAATEAKDHYGSAAIQAMYARNARRADHSTLPGRFVSTGYGLISGRGLSEKGNAETKAYEDAFSALKEYKTTLEEEALKHGDIYGTLNGRRYNYSRLMASLQRANSTGSATFDYDDGTNVYRNLRVNDFDSIATDKVKKSQAQAYSKKLKTNSVFRSKESATVNAYNKARYAASQTKKVKFDGYYESTKAAMGTASEEITKSKTTMRHIMKSSNDRQTGNKK